MLSFVSKRTFFTRKERPGPPRSWRRRASRSDTWRLHVLGAAMCPRAYENSQDRHELPWENRPGSRWVGNASAGHWPDAPTPLTPTTNTHRSKRSRLYSRHILGAIVRPKCTETASTATGKAPSCAPLGVCTISPTGKLGEDVTAHTPEARDGEAAETTETHKKRMFASLFSRILGLESEGGGEPDHNNVEDEDADGYQREPPHAPAQETLLEAYRQWWVRSCAQAQLALVSVLEPEICTPRLVCTSRLVLVLRTPQEPEARTPRPALVLRTTNQATEGEEPSRQSAPHSTPGCARAHHRARPAPRPSAKVPPLRESKEVARSCLCRQAYTDDPSLAVVRAANPKHTGPTTPLAHDGATWPHDVGVQLSEQPVMHTPILGTNQTATDVSRSVQRQP